MGDPSQSSANPEEKTGLDTHIKIHFKNVRENIDQATLSADVQTKLAALAVELSKPEVRLKIAQRAVTKFLSKEPHVAWVDVGWTDWGWGLPPREEPRKQPKEYFKDSIVK